MQVGLVVSGILTFLATLFHLALPRVFNWKEELLKLSFINKAIVNILNQMPAYLAFVYIGF